MARLPVQSREYKVMLLPERFAGSEREMRAAVARFWTDVTRVLGPWDIPSKGSFDEVKAHRRIRFFDTTAKASTASATCSANGSTSRPANDS